MSMHAAAAEKYPLPVFSRFVMNRPREIYYIGGSDILPAPLDPKREAYVASLIFFTGSKVFIALINPMVPIEIRSSTPTPVLSNFFAIYTTSLKLCSIRIDFASFS